MAEFEISLHAADAAQFDAAFHRFVWAELGDQPHVRARLWASRVEPDRELRTVTISDEAQAAAFALFWRCSLGITAATT